MIDAYFLFYSNIHEMNFTTKHESNVTGIRRSVAKRPRRLWIVVSTLLRNPFLPNSTGLSYKCLQLFNKNGAHPFVRQKVLDKT